jgi:replicative DNA helicase
VTGEDFPHDIQAEVAVLGRMMHSETSAWKIIGELDASELYRPAHGDVFRAISDLLADGRPADPITVAAKLADSGNLEAAGGRGYVHTLADNAPAVVDAHVAIVRDRARRRALLKASDEIRALAVGAEDADTAADGSAEVLVGALGKSRDAADVSLGEALVRAMKTIVEVEHPDFLTLPDLGRTLLLPGSLTVLAARPSVGKSAWAMVAAEKWGQENVPTKVYTYEMTATRLALRVIARHSGLSLPYLGQGVPPGARREEAWTAARSAMGLPVTLRPGLRGGVDRLASDMRIFAARGGRAVVIDYLALAVSGGRSGDRREDVAEAARRLKDVALSTGLVVLCLWQLNRGGVRDDGTPRPPVLSDLKESGEGEQSADNVVLLHRYDDSEQEKIRGAWSDKGFLTRDPMESRPIGSVHVAKCRDGEIVKLPAWWDAHRLTFEPCDRESAGPRR